MEYVRIVKENKMKKINLKRIFKISICIICILVLVMSIVISSNLYHLQHCTVENCSTCQMIHLAINIVNDLNLCLIILCTIGITIPLFISFELIINAHISETLVTNKVQQNK